MEQSDWLTVGDNGSVRFQEVAWTGRSAVSDDGDVGSLIGRSHRSTYRYDPFHRACFGHLVEATHCNMDTRGAFSAALATWTHATSGDRAPHQAVKPVQRAVSELPLAETRESAALFNAATRVYGVYRDVQRLHGQIAGAAVDFWDSQSKRSMFGAAVALVLARQYGWTERKAQAYVGHEYDADHRELKQTYGNIDERVSDELLGLCLSLANHELPVVQSIQDS